MHCLATAYLEVSLDVRGYFQHVLRLNGFNLLPQECQREDGRLEGKAKKTQLNRISVVSRIK